jgi:hypothetical protein
LPYMLCWLPCTSCSITAQPPQHSSAQFRPLGCCQGRLCIRGERWYM